MLNSGVHVDHAHMIGAGSRAKASHPLAGIRFLIVEDEIAQAVLLEDMLIEMGGIVSETAFNFDQARTVAHKSAFDCAVLDVNLGGTLVFPIAMTLENRRSPFVFCTAFTTAVDTYPNASGIPCVDKPVQPEKLRNAILLALATMRES